GGLCLMTFCQSVQVGYFLSAPGCAPSPPADRAEDQHRHEDEWCPLYGCALFYEVPQQVLPPVHVSTTGISVYPTIHRATSDYLAASVVSFDVARIAGQDFVVSPCRRAF